MSTAVRIAPGVIVAIFLVLLACACEAIGLHTTQSPSISMEPTIKKDEVVYWWTIGDEERSNLSVGQVVVMKEPGEPKNLRIKRIVAVGGDQLQLRANILYLNGEALDRPYGRMPGAVLSEDFGPIAIPVGTVFVMGDNWDNSKDSRLFGPVPITSVIGEVRIED